METVTVKELIEKLQEMPKDAEIFYEYECDLLSIANVRFDKDGDVILGGKP